MGGGVVRSLRLALYEHHEPILAVLNLADPSLIQVDVISPDFPCEQINLEFFGQGPTDGWTDLLPSAEKRRERPQTVVQIVTRNAFPNVLCKETRQ